MKCQMRVFASMVRRHMRCIQALTSILASLLGIFLFFLGGHLLLKLVDFDGCKIFLAGFLGLVLFCLGPMMTVVSLSSLGHHCWPWQFSLI